MEPHGDTVQGGLAANDIRYTFNINNLESLSLDLQTPITAMPLPQAELGDSQNILVKAEGNALRINISWNLVDGATSVVVPNTSDSTKYPTGPGPALETGGGSKYNGSVGTADEMVQFLTDEFQVKGVEYQFRLIIPGTPNNIQRDGIIEKISLNKTGRAPVTWKATLVFLAGDVVTVTA